MHPDSNANIWTVRTFWKAIRMLLPLSADLIGPLYLEGKTLSLHLSHKVITDTHTLNDEEIVLGRRELWWLAHWEVLDMMFVASVGVTGGVDGKLHKKVAGSSDRSSRRGSRQVSLVSLLVLFSCCRRILAEKGPKVDTHSSHGRWVPVWSEGGALEEYTQSFWFMGIFSFFIFAFKKKKHVWLLMLISADKGEKKHKGKSVSPSVIERIKMHIFNV